MNSTPPMAESMSLFVLIAVEPRCSATRSARCASITSGRTSRPSAAKIRPRMRATVVLPVPGGPVNTKCLVGGWLVRPWRSRSLATRSWAAIARTCSLTGVGLLQVGAADRDQVLAGRLGVLVEHPHVAGLAGLLQQAADEP